MSGSCQRVQRFESEVIKSTSGVTNSNNLTFSALERIQRMKKGSALFSVSKSLVSEVCGKQEKEVCSVFFT